MAAPIFLIVLRAGAGYERYVLPAGPVFVAASLLPSHAVAATPRVLPAPPPPSLPLPSATTAAASSSDVQLPLPLSADELMLLQAASSPVPEGAGDYMGLEVGFGDIEEEDEGEWLASFETAAPPPA